MSCEMTFKSGKPCTYLPLAGHDVCSHHALAFAAERGGCSPETALAVLLYALEPDETMNQ